MVAYRGLEFCRPIGNSAEMIGVLQNEPAIAVFIQVFDSGFGPVRKMGSYRNDRFNRLLLPGRGVRLNGPQPLDSLTNGVNVLPCQHKLAGVGLGADAIPVKAFEYPGLALEIVRHQSDLIEEF